MLRTNTRFVHIDSPFSIHLSQGTLAEDDVAELYSTAPIRHAAVIARTDPEHEKQYRMNLYYLMVNNQRRKDYVELPDKWRLLLDDLTGSRFTDWLSEGTGLDLSSLSRDIGVYTHLDGDFISVHKDKPSKAITAILYLNRDWPADAGGEYEIRFSGDPADEQAFRLSPRPGQLLAFPPTDISWHAVSRVTAKDPAVRLTVQLEYWFEHVDRYQTDPARWKSASRTRRSPRSASYEGTTHV